MDFTTFWNASKNEPSWIAALLLGGVVGYVVQIAFSQGALFYRQVVNRFRTKTAIEGRWFCYHWTYRDGQPVVISSMLTVRKGLRSPYVAQLKQNVPSALSYSATVSKERAHLVFHFESVNHAENTICRMAEPLGNTCDVIFGIWLSYDHDQNIASGGILLSQTELAPEAINTSVNNGFEANARRPLLRVRRK